MWCDVEWCGVALPRLLCISASLCVVCEMCAVVCGVECVCMGGVVWCVMCVVWCMVCGAVCVYTVLCVLSMECSVCSVV